MGVSVCWGGGSSSILLFVSSLLKLIAHVDGVQDVVGEGKVNTLFSTFIGI